MTRWAAFAGVTAFVLVALLVLARASQSAVERRPDRRVHAHLPDGAGHLDALDRPASSDRLEETPADRLPTGVLLVNVALSQGLLGLLLVGAAWYAAVPASALGLDRIDATVLALGGALGVALYLVNEGGAAAASALGIRPDETLRELLAPDSPGGWALLLAVVLPVIAAFEELLFRGALVGAVHAGFGVDPWVLAVLSAVAFALGHGAQGPAGIAVTGILGFVLAAAFVLTGSLVVVVVAHYLVNALEFVVHHRR